MAKVPDLMDSEWITTEEAITRTMAYLKCSREEAIEALEKVRREHPDVVVGAH